VTILERYQSRFDVRDREGSLVAICKSHRAAQAFIDAWRPAEPDGHRDEAYASAKPGAPSGCEDAFLTSRENLI
jgi:hypothetical protein